MKQRIVGFHQDDEAHWVAELVAFGIWQAPSGARIVWFKDPDGNIPSAGAVSGWLNVGRKRSLRRVPSFTMVNLPETLSVVVALAVVWRLTALIRELRRAARMFAIIALVALAAAGILYLYLW